MAALSCTQTEGMCGSEAGLYAPAGLYGSLRVIMCTVYGVGMCVIVHTQLTQLVASYYCRARYHFRNWWAIHYKPSLELASIVLPIAKTYAEVGWEMAGCHLKLSYPLLCTFK